MHYILLSVISMLLLAASYIDVRSRVIPDTLSLAILVVGVFLQWQQKQDVLSLLLLALIVFAFLLLYATVTQVIGGGDIKLISSLVMVYGQSKSIIFLFSLVFILVIYGFFLHVTKRKKSVDVPMAVPICIAWFCSIWILF